MCCSMTSGFTISTHVINTINALPPKERASISVALTTEFLLGHNPDDMLSPFERMLYTVIRFYVKRDSTRCQER